MTDPKLRQIRAALAGCSADQRRIIFDDLRKEFPIHALEQQLNVSAEIVLEAIARASDLTLRGIRGIIAEAAFSRNVMMPLAPKGWVDVTPPGDHPYDFDLKHKRKNVRVQIKNQRLRNKVPLEWKKAPPPGVAGKIYVAETQRTRSGKGADGASTRPYRFGEFDVLGVCMHPSTGNWSDFRYTVASWLVPRDNDKALIQVLQPVASVPNTDWTDNFETVVQWLTAGTKKTIWN